MLRLMPTMETQKSSILDSNIHLTFNEESSLVVQRTVLWDIDHHEYKTSFHKEIVQDQLNKSRHEFFFFLTFFFLFNFFLLIW